MSLPDFLLARIAEDEAAAREPRWLALEYGVDSYGRGIFSTRVLAECEAKRRIMERHYTSDDVWETGTCGTCGSFFPCPDLRTLAAVYSGHPDYRAEWRP